MSLNILLSRPLPLPPLQIAGQDAAFIPMSRGMKMPENVQVLCSTALDPIGADVIADLPDTVGLIANLGVGTDNIDLAAAKARGIAVSNTPVVTEDTADMTMLLILAACRQIGANERFLRAGKWSDTAPMAALGMRIHGKTLGIAGFGAIGQATARRAKGFGMNILYWNRSAKPDAEAETGAQRVLDLADMLGRSDIVCVLTPTTAQTRRMMNAERFAQCKKGAVFVNTGRGALVDDQALAAALKSGHIAAAGLDVFADEPNVPKVYLDMENVVLTPHIGGGTAECRMAVVQRGLANISAFLETGKPLDIVV